jgi:hypothetical protein
MNFNQVFSREYLQSIPEWRKQQHIDNIVQSIQNEIFNAAASGKTSYMAVKPDTRGMAQSHPSYPVLTTEDLIAGFQTRFPGCKISYEETWTQTNSTTRTLKSGIMIDWS